MLKEIGGDPPAHKDNIKDKLLLSQDKLILCLENMCALCPLWRRHTVPSQRTPTIMLSQMHQIDDLLNSSKYFYCKKTSCKLRIEICIQRQNANIERHPNKHIPFLVCQGCNQGDDNKLLASFGGSIPPENLKRGEGQKSQLKAR